MLYSLVTEPFLQKIRKKLEGFKIPLCEFNFCLSAYADDLIIVINKQSDINVLSRLIEDFGKWSSAKVNWKKSEAFLLGDWKEGKPSLPEGLCWNRWGLKYLGVFLGDDNLLQKNWDGVLQKVKGRLDKWKWLLPNMSYRGRTLIVNNLVASLLWHRLVCNDPPVKLIAEIQAAFVDFFGDKLHWIPQSILFLPKEEGGQGLIHLKSRIAAFRLHFVQRLLDGPMNVSWRAISCALLKTVGNFGMDKSLFIVDPQCFDLSKMPSFYQHLFKIWSLFQIQRTENFHSIFWLLNEPLILNARLDVSAPNFLPGFSRSLQDSGIYVLKHLLCLTGPVFQNVETFTEKLGIRSVRSVSRYLNKLKEVFTDEEKFILEEYSLRNNIPDNEDMFPCLLIQPKIEECSGCFIQQRKFSSVDFFSCVGKELYKMCVLVLNKKKLTNRVDTPWRAVLKLGDEIRPEWTVLYKPPLSKRTGDLQWRIFH